MTPDCDLWRTRVPRWSSPEEEPWRFTNNASWWPRGMDYVCVISMNGYAMHTNNSANLTSSMKQLLHDTPESLEKWMSWWWNMFRSCDRQYNLNTFSDILRRVSSLQQLFFRTWAFYFSNQQLHRQPNLLNSPLPSTISLPISQPPITQTA